MCPNTGLFVVRIFLYSDWIRGITQYWLTQYINALYSVRIQENTDQKYFHIWTLFTHCEVILAYYFFKPQSSHKLYYYERICKCKVDHLLYALPIVSLLALFLGYFFVKLLNLTHLPLHKGSILIHSFSRALRKIWQNTCFLWPDVFSYEDRI